MSIKYRSPFEPKYIKNYFPKNFKIYTFNAGFKKKNLDLLILVFDKIVPVASVYSKTSTPSAPIIWDKKNNKGYCKVLIVNSGNANAHTGLKGIKEIHKYAKISSKIFKCKLSEVLVSSTGVIGEKLDSKKIIDKLNLINTKSSKDIFEASKAIMTTDTFPKTTIQYVKSNSKIIRVFGFAKGSGMIAPNMGTMLAYIFIEANLNKKFLNSSIKKNIDSTFNSISVDGDTSTSDTVMLFAVGSNNVYKKMNQSTYKKISSAITQVMMNLSKQIVSDGEGISKLIEVSVFKAKTKKQAHKVAFSIAESSLVKTAVAGGDANWGRIVAAIGKADKEIIQNKIIIKFNNFVLAKKGAVYSKIDIKKIDSYMKNKIIKINVDLGIGKFNKKVLSSDLTRNYIKINSDYRS